MSDYIKLNSKELDEKCYIYMDDNLEDSSTARAIKIEAPCRIEIMTDDAFDRFKDNLEDFVKKYNVSIEFPLFSARNRGIKYVVFLDKQLMIGNTHPMIFQMY